MDYTTKEKVVARLSNYNADDYDALVDELVTECSRVADNFCKRILGSTEYTDYDVDGQDRYGDAKRSILLPSYPVTEFTSLKELTVKDPATYRTYSNGEYSVNSRAGILKLDGGGSFPRGIGNIRLNLTAGYLVDFENEDDPEQHTLPADITLAVTKMVVREFNLRQGAGMASENVGGSTLTYKDELDKDVQAILSNYALYEI